MGLPGQRRGRTSKRNRAAHFALKRIKLAKCGKCSEMMMSHKVCPTCGTYRGRDVLHLQEKMLKKKARKKAKEQKKK